MLTIVETAEGPRILEIKAGSAWGARRVPRWVWEAYKAGGAVTVYTARGPEPRRIIQARGRYYTRKGSV